MPDTTQYNQASPRVEAVSLDALAGVIADRQPHASEKHGRPHQGAPGR